MIVPSPDTGERPVEITGPRILLITNMWPSERDPVFGVFVRRHVQALRDAGATVRVVSNADSRTGAIAGLKKYISLVSRSLFAALTGDFDVVVGHYLYPSAAIARTAARLTRAPYVVVAHGTDARSVARDSAIARACRDAVRGAALVVTVSEALGAQVRDVTGRDASSPMAVVNMGVDTRVFAPDPGARGRHGILPRERLVLFAGNLVPVKGLDVLLEAFARLRGADSADRLVLVGDGELRESLASAAVSLGVAEHVVFTGRLVQDELASWMSSADVFVLPSRNEGLGLVLLEAMACGTPCVGSAVGGIPELLDRSCGRLVEPEAPEELALAIEETLEMGKNTMSEECVRFAATHSVDAEARRFLTEIERVVS